MRVWRARTWALLSDNEDAVQSSLAKGLDAGGLLACEPILLQRIGALLVANARAVSDVAGGVPLQVMHASECARAQAQAHAGGG